jgi:hypothetical protein
VSLEANGRSTGGEAVELVVSIPAAVFRVGRILCEPPLTASTAKSENFTWSNLSSRGIVGAAGPVSALHLPWLVRANFLATQHLCWVLAPPVIFVASQPSDPHSKLPPHWGSLQERISWVDLKLFLAFGSETWRLVAGYIQPRHLHGLRW